MFLRPMFGKVPPGRIQLWPWLQCPPLPLQKKTLACWCHQSSRTGYSLIYNLELLDWNLCQCLKIKPYVPHHYLDGCKQCKERLQVYGRTHDTSKNQWERGRLPKTPISCYLLCNKIFSFNIGNMDGRDLWLIQNTKCMQWTNSS